MKTYITIIILLSSLFLVSCKKTFFEPEPENNPVALFENLWTTFDESYAGFDERGVDWDEQYSIFQPQVTLQTTDAELYDIFKQMLNTLDDAHVHMIVPGQDFYFANNIYENKIDDELFDLDVIKQNYLGATATESGYGGNTRGMIGDIAYVHFAWVGENMLEFNDMLDEFADAKGLIIDLRHNFGGDFTYAYSELGRLTQEERYVHRTKTKNGPEKDDYSDWLRWSIYPEGEYFDKPLILLTDRYTVSAGERATMAFKVLPNLTHIGDNTNGAFSTLISRELANGWFYSVVPQKTEFEDGVNYAGIGMIPDVYVKNTEEEMKAGKDRTLEEALGRF